MEDQIIEIIKEEGPIHQGEIVDEVLDVHRCSECDRVMYPVEFEEQEREVLTILRKLLDQNDAGYTIDWKIEWVGE